MNLTGIEWCDFTWNPVTGCEPASAGCLNCYARVMAKRLAGNPGVRHRERYEGFGVSYWPERLEEPLRRRKGAKVFVCSMGDLGCEDVRYEWLEAIARVMDAAPQHRYMVLTKRPGDWLKLLPPSCWVGVTVEKQEYVWRWPVLGSCAWPGAVKFVSVEPMLGPVSFGWPLRRKPDWVIAGPETGAGARECRDEWIEKLAGECGCFFDKRKGEGRRREWPAGVDQGSTGASPVVAGRGVR